jgi:hypothetical protein
MVTIAWAATDLGLETSAPQNIQCVRTSSLGVRTTIWSAKRPFTIKEGA